MRFPHRSRKGNSGGSSTENAIDRHPYTLTSARARRTWRSTIMNSNSTHIHHEGLNSGNMTGKPSWGASVCTRKYANTA